MVMKYEKEVKYSHLDSMQLCRVGVEVHFRDDRCHENGKISECRQKRGYGDVVVCEVVKGVVVVWNLTGQQQNFSGIILK